MMMEEDLVSSYSSYEKVDWLTFGQEFEEAPEDYVFILSPTEFNEWLLLHQTFMKGVKAQKTKMDQMDLLSRFTKEHRNNLVSIITFLSASPNIDKTYKIGIVTEVSLGDCYAIFLTKPDQETSRGREVTGAVFRFRADQRQKPSLS